MTEYHDPPLRLTIEALRWMGDEWKSIGQNPAPVEMHSTDHDEDAVAVLRSLRRILSKRLTMQLFAVNVGVDALDFEAPNAPTEKDLDSLIGHAEFVLGTLHALRQLAPEVLEDDDDEDDGEPEPSPEPAGTESA